MLQNLSTSVFTDANSIQMVPIVSAEWNQNLFNPPYITVAGDGSTTNQVLGTPTPTPNSVTGSSAHPYFTTKSFTMSGGTATTTAKGQISYPVNITNGGTAYKIITYVTTDNAIPVMINAYAKGSVSQFGSANAQVNSFGWTKIITYVGSSGSTDTISSLTYTINANSQSSDTGNPTIYYTVPEVYQTTYFDYQNNSLFPTDNVFTYFRPGESYVETGNSNISFYSGYRQVTSATLDNLLHNYSTTTYAPISSIVQNPQLSVTSSPVPFFKNVLPTDINPYKYFVSDTSSKSITAIYPNNITSNKLIFKFNTIMAVPTVSISLDGSSIGTFTPNAYGVLTLYYNGTSWSQTKWDNIPKFTNSGALSINSANFKKITINQTSIAIKSDFASFSNTQFSDPATGDVNRMHLVEASPRLEIDLSDFVTSLDINKYLDGKDTYIPISSLNSNDANISFSAIPLYYNNGLISLFSNQSNQNATVLSNMLRKNIKFYINFNVKSYMKSSDHTYLNSNTYVPGGIFYSDTWTENDIDEIKVQCFDVTRYLQTLPAPDYVANLKTVYEIVSNILDLSGFTDYDIDSLYNVCNDKAIKMDLFYYYVNSKDTTIVEALNRIFLPYQIGSYVDEYGIMHFKSLSQILSNKTSDITLNDSNINQGGYSVENKAKPGKISIRYTSPKIKQSQDLQTVTDPSIRNSPSFVYATANDVVWQQQTLDSVGYNYLFSDMSETDSIFNLNKNVASDFFHSFNLNNNGYVAIENEIVSLSYKQYKISKYSDPSISTTVSVANDLELASEINKFTKRYKIGLLTSNLDSNGNPTASTDFDVLIEPTGNISNVQRGLFGTKQTNHTLINSSISDKSLSEGVMNSSYSVSSGSNTSVGNAQTANSNIPSVKQIVVQSSSNNKTIIYPTTERDNGYSTYSTKFNMPDQSVTSGGLFFNMQSTSSTSNTYFVELIRYNQTNPKTNILYSPANYRYILALYRSGGTIIAWADVTGQCQSIVGNFEKILVDAKTTPPSFTYAQDQYFHLKIAHYHSDGTDGESSGEVLLAFLNNIQITGWQVPSTSTSDFATGWKQTDINSITGLRKNPILPTSISTGTIFGFFSSITPVSITGVTYPSSSSTNSANLREIYACEKLLKERSVSYLFQDRQILSGIVQNQNLFSKYKSYIMQTNPIAIGINLYDVQYTNPAAVTVDVLPIAYTLFYFANESPTSQNFYQRQDVDEYSLAYSSILNTGFRAKLAIANNSSHLVYLSKQSDALKNATVVFNLWAHELIAPSDPEILDHVIDPSNLLEIVQMDSEWIQSKDAANKTLAIIEKAIDGFSKDVSLSIFGNPLIQVGDVVTLTYSLAGLNQQKYVVHTVQQSFKDGLETKLLLNMIDKGVSY